MIVSTLWTTTFALCHAKCLTTDLRASLIELSVRFVGMTPESLRVTLVVS